MKEFGRRLRSAVRATDIGCRLAGDEFTIIREGGMNVSESVTVANKILSVMAPPFVIDGKPQRVTTNWVRRFVSSEY